jgi:hypothetical protein
MIGTFFDGSPFCLIGMKPLPNTPLLLSIQVKRGLRKRDQYYWVSVHENPRGSQEVNTLTMGVRNNIKVLQEVLDLFPKELSRLHPKRKVDHAIELTPRVASISHVPYRHSLLEINELETQIKDLLEKGYINLVSFHGGRLCCLKRKIDGTLRMCVDYCWLNKLTIKNKFPFPHINDIFDYLWQTQVFLKIDLCSGYHQIQIKKWIFIRRLFRPNLDTTNL